ncbi:MAG: MbeCy [Erysipelotrichaceae bacterium]
MVKRTKEIKIRLSEDELNLLNEKASICKCSREKFSRLVLFDVVPSVPPPIEYYRLLKEWNAIGINLNQLTKLAHIQRMTELPVDSVLTDLHELIKRSDEQIRGIG